MPTYEYACSACNNEWEFEQSIKDDPIKECPKCHEQTARRQISRGTGFILKGSGWYSRISTARPQYQAEPRWRRQAHGDEDVDRIAQQHGFVVVVQERIDVHVALAVALDVTGDRDGRRKQGSAAAA